jgi:hypothetical protein
LKYPHGQQNGQHFAIELQFVHPTTTYILPKTALKLFRAIFIRLSNKTRRPIRFGLIGKGAGAFWPTRFLIVFGEIDKYFAVSSTLKSL